MVLELLRESEGIIAYQVAGFRFRGGHRIGSEVKYLNPLASGRDCAENTFDSRHL
jgi:hypothetical protein